MRRVICFVLALVLVFSMSCVAFATFLPSPGGGSVDDSDPDDGMSGGCNHKYVNGVCKYCGAGYNPKTGDIIMFWVIVLLVSMAALGVMVFVYRKKFGR